MISSSSKYDISARCRVRVRKTRIAYTFLELRSAQGTTWYVTCDRIPSTYGVTKPAITPATGDLIFVREDSNLIEDQRKFMSLNATLMYASKRTYPENSFAVDYLSSRYNKATDDDYANAMRVAEYIVGCEEKHGLILSPKSMQVLAKSDASYAEHADGKSHTGGCVGFDSDYACGGGVVYMRE